MKTNRRTFVNAAITGGIASALPLSACGPTVSNTVPAAGNANYSKLDEILNKPVFKKESFAAPVIISNAKHRPCKV